MSAFVAVRHTITGGIGSVPVEALEIHLANGWVVISDPAPDPFHLDVASIDPAAPETEAGRELRHALRPVEVGPVDDEIQAPPVEVNPFDVAYQLAQAVDPTGATPAGLLEPAAQPDPEPVPDPSTKDAKPARAAVVKE